MIIFPVVLHGSETWSLTFRGEQRLRISRIKYLECNFLAKRGEIVGKWKIKKDLICGVGGLLYDTIHNLSTPVVQWLSYSHLDSRFAGSIPAGVDGFLQSVKITSFGREVKPWVPCRRFTARKRISSRN